MNEARPHVDAEAARVVERLRVVSRSIRYRKLARWCDHLTFYPLWGGLAGYWLGGHVVPGLLTSGPTPAANPWVVLASAGLTAVLIIASHFFDALARRAEADTERLNAAAPKGNPCANSVKNRTRRRSRRST